MPDGYIRQLASGNWAATVRLRDGSRPTETFALKDMAVTWARETKRADQRGEYIDPKLGRITVGQLWERFADGRRLERASRNRDASTWRVHVAPRWADVRAGTILKPDITGWVTAMERAGTGAATIEAAIGVLRSMLEIAVDARLIRVNVAVGVAAPERDAHLDRILDDHEDELLLANLDARWPDAPFARLFVEVMLYAGLRYEEAAALDRDHVDMRKRLLHIGPVMEKDGSIRPFPKTPSGVRPVPVDDDLWPRLREHVMTIPSGGLVFTAAQGGKLLYDNWRGRVWAKALVERVPMSDAEIEAYVAARKAVGKRSGWRPDYWKEVPLLADPQPTPHDLRHTYLTRLGESGMPIHEMMAISGHATTQSLGRYLHPRDGRFDKARAAMANVRRRASTSD